MINELTPAPVSHPDCAPSETINAEVSPRNSAAATQKKNSTFIHGTLLNTYITWNKYSTNKTPVNQKQIIAIVQKNAWFWAKPLNCAQIKPSSVKIYSTNGNSFVFTIFHLQHKKKYWEKHTKQTHFTVPGTVCK